MTYAPFVYSAFAVYLLVFAWDALAPWLRHRRLARSIRLRARRDEARQAPARQPPAPEPTSGVH